MPDVCKHEAFSQMCVEILSNQGSKLKIQRLWRWAERRACGNTLRYVTANKIDRVIGYWEDPDSGPLVQSVRVRVLLSRSRKLFEMQATRYRHSSLLSFEK
ncbi:hypothetical protein EVAR_70618_1 [Eumeta japonica]|uniref:Uncharacterized protein n=1 Tax=Eumeta variegata TaxID=151549 RepID=A0A4C2A7Z4_EUMVA|nr:hypothetical protein EVAR_70618_1 [Eumeta japonica]